MIEHLLPQVVICHHSEPRYKMRRHEDDLKKTLSKTWTGLV